MNDSTDMFQGDKNSVKSSCNPDICEVQEKVISQKLWETEKKSQV